MKVARAATKKDMSPRRKRDEEAERAESLSEQDHPKTAVTGRTTIASDEGRKRNEQKGSGASNTTESEAFNMRAAGYAAVFRGSKCQEAQWHAAF